MEKHYKIITLGSYNVGKTCILMHATDPNFIFPQNYICTIGVDTRVKVYNYPGQVFKFTIWDTAGQERFYSVNRFYFDGCLGVILVYDITSYESFEKIPYYIEDFNKQASNKALFVLVGNKNDAKNRQVAYEEGQKMAARYEMPFIECSAMTGENIEDIFEAIVHQMEEKSLISSEGKSSISINTGRKKRKCCFFSDS